jgi:hypothetical protein
MTTATGPAADPDRASFTTAVQTAADQLITAQHITPAPGQPSTLTRAIQATLLRPRRPRYSARRVKSPRSRYPSRPGDPRPLHPATITAITITITSPPPGTHCHPPRKPRKPTPGSRRDLVTTLMQTRPTHRWTTRELATQLHLPLNHLTTQLGQWTRGGFLTRTSRRTYTLNTPPKHWTPTPDP